MIRLSRYFHDMTTSIHDHGGTVDKFIGDAIMAFWNAPRPDENHAENACLAALGCLRANRAIDDALAEAGQPPMPTRFGLHTGEVVVGNVGSSDRMQYTALGSNVNLASRVESLNKQYGTQALVTGAVERIARHRFVFRQVDLAIPSGLSEPIALFELIGARDPGIALRLPARNHQSVPALAGRHGSVPWPALAERGRRLPGARRRTRQRRPVRPLSRPVRPPPGRPAG